MGAGKPKNIPGRGAGKGVPESAGKQLRLFISRAAGGKAEPGVPGLYDALTRWKTVIAMKSFVLQAATMPWLPG